MLTQVAGLPARRYLQVELQPGEQLLVVASALSSWDADCQITRVNPGGRWGRGWCNKVVGKALLSLRLNNRGLRPVGAVLAHPTAGELMALSLAQGSVCLAPGHWVAATADVTWRWRFTGWRAWLQRRQLLELQLSGTGWVWYACGASLQTLEVDGSLRVATQYLVARSASLKARENTACPPGFIELEGRGSCSLQAMPVGLER